MPDGGFAILDFLNAHTRHEYPANPDNKAYYTAEQILSQASEAGFRRSSILGEPNRRVLLLLGGAMNINDVIYLDNNATTPLDEAVLAAMLPCLREQFGNPASGHVLGPRRPRRRPTKSRLGRKAARRPLGPDRLHRLGDRGQ